MKRMFQLATILMFVLGVIGTPVLYAEEPSQKRDVIKKEVQRDLIKKGMINKFNKSTVNRSAIRGITREDVRKLEKIGLKESELRRLGKLEKWKLKKLSRLEKKKLVKLARLEPGELRKLATLDDARLERLAMMDESRLKKIGKLSRADIKRLAMKNPDDMARIDIDREIIKRDKFREKAFVKRKIARERMKKAREDFKLAKEQRMRAKNQLLNARGEFFAAKKALEACEGVNTTRCDEVRENVKMRSKAFLLHAADIIIAELEKVKAKLESSEELNEEEAAEWIADIDAKIEEVKDTKAAIEAAETKEEIVAAAKAIKVEWLYTKHQIKKLTGLLIHKRVGGIIAKADILEERLEEVLSGLEEEGVDTTEIDAQVDIFSEKIAEARAEYELAQEKWAEVEEIRSSYGDVTPEDLRKADQLVKEARDHIKAAYAALRDAHAALRKIVRLVKASGANITDPDMPDYTPGEDLGYFIWQSSATGNSGVWTICLSGDGDLHTGKGTVEADGGFPVVRPFLYERGTDKYIIFDTKIAFRDRVKSHQDCLRFGTASEEVTFELYIDGKQTDRIFVGKDNTQYTSPVTLAGKPCAGCTGEGVESEAAVVEEGYELMECSTDEGCDGEGVICSADGVCVEEEEEGEEGEM